MKWIMERTADQLVIKTLDGQITLRIGIPELDTQINDLYKVSEHLAPATRENILALVDLLTDLMDLGMEE